MFPFNEENYQKKNENKEEKNTENHIEEINNDSDINDNNIESLNKNEEEEKDESKNISENLFNIIEENISFIDYLKCVRLYTCFFMCCFKNVHNNLILSLFTILALHYNTVSVETQKNVTTISFIVNLISTAALSLIIDKFR